MSSLSDNSFVQAVAILLPIARVRKYQRILIDFDHGGNEEVGRLCVHVHTLLSKSIGTPAYLVFGVNEETLAQGWSSWMRGYKKNYY